MEDVARKITRSLYGDDYDNSKYEKILTCLPDFEKSGSFIGLIGKLGESFNGLITDSVDNFINLYMNWKNL